MAINRTYYIFIVLFIKEIAVQCKNPNIVIFLADDLGWNDVGFHGSNQIPTPNIDALAYNGVVLDRLYAQPACTPSRAALLTGNYPIRSGYQGYPLRAGENRTLDMPTMPQHFKSLGYKTYLVGKWHLGHPYRSSLPTSNGFDYYFGHLNGYIGYFDKQIEQNGFTGWDLHENLEPAWNFSEGYATDLYTQKSLDIIKKHDPSISDEPMFLLVSHLAPHTGKNGTELEVKDKNQTDCQFGHIDDTNRRMYAGVVDSLDESLGEIVSALSNLNMLNDTIIVFLSDNGAQTIGMHQNFGSNWPLRGMKFTLHEGGVRVPAVIFSPKIPRETSVYDQLVHLVDIFPTLYSAGGGNVSHLGPIDGVDLWKTLNSFPTQPIREELLLNIDEKLNMSSMIGVGGRFKLIKGTYQNGAYDGYFGESGRGSENPGYNFSLVLNSKVNVAMSRLGKNLTVDKILSIRSSLDLSSVCNAKTEPRICSEVCLFDLKEDPCESNDLASDRPDVVEALTRKIVKFSEELVPQKNRPFDEDSNPANCHGAWFTWLEEDGGCPLGIYHGRQVELR